MAFVKSYLAAAPHLDFLIGPFDPCGVRCLILVVYGYFLT